MLDIHTLLRRALSDASNLTPQDHDAWLEHDRASYAALLPLLAGVPAQAIEIVIRLLAVTRDARGVEVDRGRKIEEDHLIAGALAGLPPRLAIDGLLELVRRRVNNQRTSGCIRSYVFGSPDLEAWAVTHRAKLRRLVVHALGKRTASSCLRLLGREPGALTPMEQAYLSRHVDRHATDRALARDVFLHLFGALRSTERPRLRAYLEARADLERGRGLPYRTMQGIAGTFHPGTPRRKIFALSVFEKEKRDVGETADMLDDSLVGLIRAHYRTRDEALVPKIRAELERTVERIPRWNARLAVVLDASQSMCGVGQRLYNAMAIAIAVMETAALRVARCDVVTIGQQHERSVWPEPRGATALAPALLEAAGKQPDAILVISDGWENAQQGDTKVVAQALKMIGVCPIVHIVPAFTDRDQLEGRVLSPDWPLFIETGLGGLDRLWLKIRIAADPAGALETLRRAGGAP
jgi:hypothetical protein